jgi:hypothetical protein
MGYNIQDMNATNEIAADTDFAARLHGQAGITRELTSLELALNANMTAGFILDLLDLIGPDSNIDWED